MDAFQFRHVRKVTPGLNRKADECTVARPWANVLNGSGNWPDGPMLAHQDDYWSVQRATSKTCSEAAQLLLKNA